MKIIENISLKNFNTFKVDVSARYFIEINYLSDLEELINSGILQNHKFFILGEGSNVLFTKDFDGIIIKINIKGINIIETNDDYALIEAFSGENWSKFVEICVKNNLSGLENLAGIPGKVGSAPVQNIGAYNVEQKDAFVYLEGYDLLQNNFRKVFISECNFDYRNSVFKNELKDKFIITKVVYRLSKKFEPNISYVDLQNELKKFNITKPDLLYIYNTIIRIRKKKLPDVETFPNAGSFFKNPFIEENILKILKNDYPEIPHFPVKNNLYKIPAGWLIEKCGWKGYRKGDVGVSEKHSLVLINYSSATGEQVFELAQKIRHSVFEKFNILLEFEVIIL